MNLIGLPRWITPHLFPDKKYKDLSLETIATLKETLKRFNDPDPEVTVVIPAWNEEDNIFRTLSSLAASTTKYRTEIMVVNNNSTDKTQEVLDTLGVRSFFQPMQGTQFARQMGLDNARGKYHLCADSDTFYPPDWIDLMIAPMAESPEITGVYGRYSFIPPAGQSRIGMFFYEFFAGIFIQIRKRKREYMNVYGFNMGFVTNVGRTTGGFNPRGGKVYTESNGSDYTNEAEDGRMALNLSTLGRLKRVTDTRAIVFTSTRRLLNDGSLTRAFLNRGIRQLKELRGY